VDVKKMDVEFASNQGHGYSLVSEAREGEVTDRIKDKTIIDLGAGQTFLQIL